MPPRWSWARPMSAAISHRAWAARTLPSCSQRGLDAMFGSATDPRPTGARCTAHATTSTTRSCRSARAIGARWWKAFYGGDESPICLERREVATLFVGLEKVRVKPAASQPASIRSHQGTTALRSYGTGPRAMQQCALVLEKRRVDLTTFILQLSNLVHAI